MMRRILHRWLRRAGKRRELFVHEDDWGQIEVLPAACAAWYAEEFARIAAFASAHAAPDGGGWTDVYRRPAPPQRIADLRISFADAADRLAGRLAEFDAVVSGTFSSAATVPRVRAFGPAPATGIVLVPDRSGAVLEMVSLLLEGPDAACAEVVSAAAALPAPAPLVIVDWARGALTPL